MFDFLRWVLGLRSQTATTMLVVRHRGSYGTFIERRHSRNDTKVALITGSDRGSMVWAVAREHVVPRTIHEVNRVTT